MVEPKPIRKMESFKLKNDKEKMSLLELVDIEKKYFLTLANLKLLQKNPQIEISSKNQRIFHKNLLIFSGSILSAKDAVTLLCENNLFDTAVNLNKLFQFDFKIIFEVLTKKCLQDH